MMMPIFLIYVTIIMSYARVLFDLLHMQYVEYYSMTMFFCDAYIASLLLNVFK